MTTNLPTIPRITTLAVQAECITLCDAAAAALDPPARLDVAALVSAAITARSALVDETFEAAFDAGLVRWAPDGALVPA